MKKVLGFAFFIQILLVQPVSLWAQNGGAAGAFLRIGFGARGISMSNAISSVPEMGSNGFYNPALVAGLVQRNFETGTSVMAFDRHMHAASASFRLPPSAGLNLLLLNAGVSNIDGRSLSGYPTGSFNANDYLVQASFGVRSNKRLSFGASIKFLISNYHPEIANSVAFGLDAGILFRASETTMFSFVAKDLLLTHKWRANDLYGGQDQLEQNDYFPTTLLAGVSHRILDGKVILSGEVLTLIHENQFFNRVTNIDFNPPTSQIERENTTTAHVAVQFGALYQIHERFRISAGFAQRDVEFSGNESFSTGFSILLPYDAFMPSIDYALSMEPNVRTFIHSISFRFHL
jgi:hypothetical protein